jgi:hydroxyacylglutathione hydrolase
MDRDIFTIPLKVPCFLVKTRDSFVMIDTGDMSDQANLEKELDRRGVTPENLKLVLLTHGDFDHTGNAAFLQKKFGVKIAMHAEDAGMVERGDQGWHRKAKSDRITVFGRIIIFISSTLLRPSKFNTFKPDLYVEDGQDLSEYGFAARVLHLPGHSKGSIGILTTAGDLFCGDLLMNMMKPDFHFMIDDWVDRNASLNKLKMSVIKTVYPGHGRPFLLERFIQKYR